VGYRVNSIRATQFRQWATQVLKDFAIKGYVLVAKNYLSKEEIDSLGRIVNAYLELAEERALREIPMTMEDWVTRLDRFIRAMDTHQCGNQPSSRQGWLSTIYDQRNILFILCGFVLENDDMTDFDMLQDRSQSAAEKWNREDWREHFGFDDLLPFWVADMEFQAPPAVCDSLARRARDGIFGHCT